MRRLFFLIFILSFSITPTSYFVDRRVLKISKYWFFFSSFSWRARSRMHVHVRQRTVVCGTFFFLLFHILRIFLLCFFLLYFERRGTITAANTWKLCSTVFVCGAHLCVAIRFCRGRDVRSSLDGDHIQCIRFVCVCVCVFSCYISLPHMYGNSLVVSP